MGTNFQTTPDAVAKGAASINGLGAAMYANCTNIFSQIGGLKSVWIGKSYNDLVDAFNGMIEGLDKAVKLIAEEIPNLLVTAMNNYLRADGSPTIGTQYNIPGTITSLSKGATDVVKYDEAAANNVKLSVEQAFKGVIEQLNQVGSTVNGLAWTGEAAETVKNAIASTKATLTSNFEDVISKYGQAMSDAQAAFASAESANMGI